MSVAFDQKEDLRLRMADLERKLAESEEERCRLEKTCNVLLRAFREEEKMQYKALNQKYEKFLEDCSARKRRNEIILKSLCRIEDRSRALSAKTERLKLLKDRYICYLSISDHRKGEIHGGSRRSFPSSSRATSGLLPQHVSWTTPLETHLKTERLKEGVRDLLGGSGTSHAVSGHLFARVTDGGLEKLAKEESRERRRDESRKTSGSKIFFNGDSKIEASNVEYASNPVETRYDCYDAQAASKEIKVSEKLNEIEVGASIAGSDTAEITLRGKQVTGYNDYFEKVKEGLSSEEHFSRGNNGERGDPHDEKVLEKPGLEQSGSDSLTKENNSKEVPPPRINYHWSCSPDTSTCDEEKQELDNKESEVKADSRPDYQEEGSSLFPSRENGKPLPMGLDGVDYQNETYPESYYEQPVHHHNHTSIASDVILEEDETEQEFDEGEKESRQTPGQCEPQPLTETSKQASGQIKGHVAGTQDSDEVKGQESDSEKSWEADKSDKSQEKRDKKKTAVRSNLIHLLESDSESFQIEHGDLVSGNEDTDFDFSFHQN